MFPGKRYLLEHPEGLLDLFYPVFLRRMPLLRLGVPGKASLVHARTCSRIIKPLPPNLVRQC